MRYLYLFCKNNIYHFGLAFIAALMYGFPSRRLFVIGVTGTKGKSTVVELIAHILERGGKKVAVSSSVRHSGVSGLTMPGRFYLQRFLRRAVGNGYEYAVIEVTSQGIDQHRHRFIQWGAAIFTNLMPEHIEAHGSFEKYREAKVSFFRYAARTARLFIINKGDANARYFIAAVTLLGFHPNRVVLYGTSDIPSLLIGDFNKYNIGAAAAVTRSLGISDAIIEQAIAEFSGIPGRMEFIQREPFAVVVDYALTPASLEAVYQTLLNLESKIMNHGRLLCVFGSAGGGRDAWKRSVMGEVAARYCDEIILTDDDSYDEPVEKIMNEIEKGILNSKRHTLNTISHQKIIDRREAIKIAIGLARPGDVVAITGKGGDQWLRIAGGKKIPWSDQRIVSDILKETT